MNTIQTDDYSVQDSHGEDDSFEIQQNNFFDGIVGFQSSQQQKTNSSAAIRDKLLKQTEQNLSKQTTLAQKLVKKRARVLRRAQANNEYEEVPDQEVPLREVDDEVAKFSGVRNDAVFAMDTEFQSLGLGKSLLRALIDMDFTHPTRVQKQSIPFIMSGKDVLVSSMTVFLGSGKTAAFLLPALQRFGGTLRSSSYTKVLIVTPTRELALQCYEMLEQLNKYSKCTATLVIGAVPIQKQEVELRKHPDIVIATPGRLLDLLKNSYSIDLQNIEMLIFDEADRLLEMGFEKEIKEIVRETPSDRQTILFSATMNAGVTNLTDLALKKPITIKVDYDQGCASGLTQYLVRIRSNLQEDREAYLLAMLNKQFTSKTIIFVKTKKQCHRIAMILGLLGMSACELHGNLAMQQRIKAFEEFREGKYNYLLATDLAARGLDIQDVKAVVNYEIPFEVTQYIHRVGRTARIGSEGVSVTLCLEKEVRDFKKMIRNSKQSLDNLKVSIKRVEMYKEKIATLEGEIWKIVQEELDEREFRLAEMEARKVENILNHEDEILNKPKKQWIESFREKLVRQNVKVKQAPHRGKRAGSNQRRYK